MAAKWFDEYEEEKLPSQEKLDIFFLKVMLLAGPSPRKYDVYDREELAFKSSLYNLFREDFPDFQHKFSKEKERDYGLLIAYEQWEDTQRRTPRAGNV